jgi:cytochrome c oxidase subunit 2
VTSLALLASRALVAPAALVAQPYAVADQSALRAGGPAAARIGELWNLLLVTGTIATVVTLALLLYALFRRRRPDELPPEADREADPRGEQANDESGGRGRAGTGRPASERAGARWMVIGGLVIPTVVLGAVLVVTLRTLAAVVAPADALARETPAPGEHVVEVTGRQFWWEVRYLDAEPARVFETANELRIPVGRPVLLRLRSLDVIHSFWVPGLQGKMDLVPGRVNVLRIQADRPGSWRGQCAEFCGVQHAKMALVVVAEPPERYERWAAAQRRPAPAPADSLAHADRAAFLASGCVLCHAVRGTPAGGDLGPDLTHVASRLTLAAGVLPNRPGNLYGWIADPQSHKPGSRMPALPLAPAQLHAIARYLATLR